MIDDILELLVDVAEEIAKKRKREVPPAVAASEEAGMGPSARWDGRKRPAAKTLNEEGDEA